MLYADLVTPHTIKGHPRTPSISSSQYRKPHRPLASSRRILSLKPASRSSSLRRFHRRCRWPTVTFTTVSIAVSCSTRCSTRRRRRIAGTSMLSRPKARHCRFLHHWQPRHAFSPQRCALGSPRCPLHFGTLAASPNVVVRQNPRVPSTTPSELTWLTTW